MSLYPTAERRIRILETLIERRHEKIGVLAEEFQVCRSTISRDYQMLSVYHPLYSKRVFEEWKKKREEKASADVA